MYGEGIGGIRVRSNAAHIDKIFRAQLWHALRRSAKSEFSLSLSLSRFDARYSGVFQVTLTIDTH